MPVDFYIFAQMFVEVCVWIQSECAYALILVRRMDFAETENNIF